MLSYVVILKYPVYPCHISRDNIHDDIQLLFAGYIQVYPCLSNIDIHIRYPWCYPIMFSCYIRLYPWYLSFWSYMLCGFFWAFSAVCGFFWLQRLANILKYPFISFHPTEGKKIAYFQSRTQHLVHNEQKISLDIKRRYPEISMLISIQRYPLISIIHILWLIQN